MEVYSQLPSQDKAIFKVQIGILWLYTIKVRVFFRNGIFLAFFGNLFQYLIFLTVNLSFFFFLILSNQNFPPCSWTVASCPFAMLV